MLDYYGLDWILLALGLATKYLTIQQNRLAFVTSIFACSAGMVVAYMANQYGLVVFNAILIAMSCKGFVHWGNLAKQRQNTPPPAPARAA